MVDFSIAGSRIYHEIYPVDRRRRNQSGFFGAINRDRSMLIAGSTLTPGRSLTFRMSYMRRTATNSLTS